MTDFSRFRRTLPPDATVAHWRAGDGWTLRRFDWPSAGGRGSILFQGGRGDVFEKYLEAFAHWHAAGWSVTSVDWRGQGGSGRFSANPNVGHLTSFAPLIDDLAAVWAQGAAGPRVLMGHSMGGFLALRAMLDRRVAPDAAVLVAPMLGLRSPVGPALGEKLARVMARLGDPARAAWKANERPGGRLSRQALLTADLDRYADEEHWYAANPAIRLGPPSWTWLAAAFAGTRALARADLAAMRVPTLLLVAEADGLVDPRAALAIGARLGAAEIVRFGRESAHEILREADPVRTRALAAIDDFLARKASA